MSPLSRRLSRAAAVALLSFPALASTWVVDDNPGPGVDFTNLQAAIDAASPGDTLLVMPGQYSEFTLSKALRILGQDAGGSIDVMGTSRVQSIASGQLVALADLSFRSSVWFVEALDITGCAGTIVVDGVHLQYFAQITSSSDVRLRRVSAPAGPSVVSAVSSRVEIVESALIGWMGARSTEPEQILNDSGLLVGDG